MSLEVVIGPMFSGKTSYAISYIRKQTAIGKKVLVIKPNIDDRYSNENIIVSHDGVTSVCEIWNVNESLSGIQNISDYDCIVIEEAQFFKGLRYACHEYLFELKKDILVVGLSSDSTQTRFGDIIYVIPFATKVTKLSALCSVCKDGTLAHFTKRKVYDEDENQIDVGGEDKYIAVCLRHL